MSSVAELPLYSGSEVQRSVGGQRLASTLFSSCCISGKVHSKFESLMSRRRRLLLLFSGLFGEGLSDTRRAHESFVLS